jgi:uncharacterized membrane protein
VSKYLLLSETNKLGGKNYILGFIFLGMAAIVLIIIVIFIAMYFLMVKKKYDYYDPENIDWS